MRYILIGSGDGIWRRLFPNESDHFQAKGLILDSFLRHFIMTFKNIFHLIFNSYDCYLSEGSYATNWAGEFRMSIFHPLPDKGKPIERWGRGCGYRMPHHSRPASSWLARVAKPRIPYGTAGLPKGGMMMSS